MGCGIAPHPSLVDVQPPSRALAQGEVDGSNIEFGRLSLEVLHGDAEVFGDLGQQLAGGVQLLGGAELLEALGCERYEAAHLSQPSLHGITVSRDVFERLEIVPRGPDGLAASTVGHVGDQLDVVDPQSLRKLAGERGGASSSGHSLYSS